MNQIPIHTVGRLIGDPERLYRRDGMAVTRITVEVIERRLTPEGWRRAGTTRLECRAWAGLAEHIYASLGAGDRVVVSGRLRQRVLTGGSHDYDVVLDDLGASLVFTNVRPVPVDGHEAAANQITVHASTQKTDHSCNGPVDRTAS